MASKYGYVDPEWPNPMGDGDATVIIYGYTPSFALAVLGCVLFSISLLLHVGQLIRYRTFYFGIPMVIACAMEIVGYICRSLSARADPYRVVFFVVQYFFIVVPPVLIAASIYAVLSVMINNLGRKYSPLLKPSWIVTLFVTCDCVATIIQVAGAALIGVSESNREDPTTANNILKAGLAFQVVTFFVFLVLLFVFLFRARRPILGSTKTKTFTIALLVACCLVYLRTCFRLAETSQGLQGKLETHEVYFGTLEFMPIALSVLLFNMFHPGKWVPKSTRKDEVYGS